MSIRLDRDRWCARLRAIDDARTGAISRYDSCLLRIVPMSDLETMVASIAPRVAFTHLDKVLYPEQGLTKAALLAYYAVVAEWMLPHVTQRPLTLVRCPEGSGHPCFFQKHAKKGTPRALHRISIAEEGGSVDDYMVLDDLDGLLSAVQLGSLELHVWGSHADQVERPDQLIFDLDPDPSVDWDEVVAAALDLRKLLAGMKLESWVKTTGGKGLHVVLPIQRKLDWDQAKAFTKAVSSELTAHAPKRFTVNPSKAQRKGKIFIDYLRNGRGATAVAPYSTRARPGAPVATPLSWTELERGVDPTAFDIGTVPVRLRKQKRDPWANLLIKKQSVTAAMLRELGVTKRA